MLVIKLITMNEMTNAVGMMIPASGMILDFDGVFGSRELCLKDLFMIRKARLYLILMYLSMGWNLANLVFIGRLWCSSTRSETDGSSVIHYGFDLVPR